MPQKNKLSKKSEENIEDPKETEDSQEVDIKQDNSDSSRKVKRKKTKKIKKRTIKKIIAVTVLIAVLAVVLYFAFRTLKPEKTIAEVNGEIITKQELEQQYAQLPDQYKLFITEDDFLDQMINVRLLLQEAKKQAITVSEAEIEKELDSLKKEAPTEEAFEELLKQRDISLSQFKKQLGEQLTINKLLNETVFSKIKVSDSQIADYYNSNKGYFKENNLSYSSAKEQIRLILLDELSNTAINVYISQLRSNATILKGGVPATTRIETFAKTNDTICREDGKLVVRLFSTTKNSDSKWISSSFDEVMNQYKDDVIAYHWQLDTGDNTLTKIKEQGIPKKEVEIFQKYNPQSTVPTYVFGCKYVRIKNAYKTLGEEKAEFSRVIEQLLA